MVTEYKVKNPNKLIIRIRIGIIFGSLSVTFVLFSLLALLSLLLPLINLYIFLFLSVISIFYVYMFWEAKKICLRADIKYIIDDVNKTMEIHQFDGQRTILQLSDYYYTENNVRFGGGTLTYKYARNFHGLQFNRKYFQDVKSYVEDFDYLTAKLKRICDKLPSGQNK